VSSISRVDEEVDLLRGWFGRELEFVIDGQWVRVPHYTIPSDLWIPREVEVCFQVPAGLPGQAPYAFHVRPEVRLTNGEPVKNYTFPTATYFGDGWGTFSWQLSEWQPGAEPANGTNMLDFARSFAQRFLEGA
jgi:hypothetical protein